MRIKYSNAGVISIKCNYKDDNLIIVVQDEGVAFLKIISRLSLIAFFKWTVLEVRNLGPV